MPAVAELMAMSNFSFREGASHPHELVLAARALGLAALAITDRNSAAGLVRGHLAAREHGLRFVPGARIDLRDGCSYLVWPTDRPAWGRLAQLITTGRRRAPKGECHLAREDFLAHAEGQAVALLAPPASRLDAAFDTVFATRLRADADALRGAAALPLHLAIACPHAGRDQARLDAAAGLGAPLLAVGDVRYHAPARRPLADVLSAIRLGRSIEALGLAAEANAERHLHAPEETARRFRRHPGAIAAQARILEACRFGLDELAYEYPDEILLPGQDAEARLAALTAEGALRRYPGGVPQGVQLQLEHELGLIAELGYAPYFLTVHDIVRFARERGILCQGRGSAANSAVCFVLGITEVDPAKHDLLFERFVSAARGEPPDIDVDFEHERREEVIQHIYAKYGRDRAGLAATVIHWRARSALREVGRAFGLSEDMLARIGETAWGEEGEDGIAGPARRAGLDRRQPRTAMMLALAAELVGFPRHLSQHVGGFVITRGKLSALCPVVNAAMAGRTTIEWDKDDIEALGILKVDVLALGMLSCLRKAFDLVARQHGRRYTLATIPPGDAAVYDMLCRGDSVGVFQVESRAQMAMLPRLRPRCFNDLVIEVAIVRPGPIQGDMVHPYLRRRSGEETVEYPNPELRQVLEGTLGVPLFQEQAMRIAIVAAGFTPAEADRLRRAMATFRHDGTIERFRTRMVEGMLARGYDRGFAETCFRQIQGFSTYGFPQSHAASFALLVYASAWLKHHFPAAFAGALLNSQPMGFYRPAQLVRDAKAHGVVVLAPCVNASAWDSVLVAHHASRGGAALRLGLREIKGFSRQDAGALVAAREAGNARPFASIEEIMRRSGLGRAALLRLAGADACAGLGLSRRAALWQAAALDPAPPALLRAADADLFDEPAPRLARMGAGEEVLADYAATALSLRAHPLALLRGTLARAGLVSSRELGEARHGSPIRLAGLVLVRQRPGTAGGIVFVTLEDEFGTANLVVMPPVLRRFRAAVVAARLLAVEGIVERRDFPDAPVIHVRVRRASGRDDLLARLGLPAAWAPPADAPDLTVSDLPVSDLPVSDLPASDLPAPGHRPVPLPRSRDFH